MKKIALVLSFLVAMVAVGGVGAQSAQAATGDVAASITFSQDCGTGVGIAFDGTNLWYSCLGEPDLRRANPTTGVVDATFDSVPGGLGAISYDATRNAIWGAVAPNNVYRIDLDAAKNVVGSTLVFSAAGESCGIIDGLAFDARNLGDPNDDVFYYSDDCFVTTINVYDMTGSLVESFPVPPGFGAHNSGLGIGGQILYEADLFNQQIYGVDKTTKAVVHQFSSAIPGDPNFHSEDLECDTITFAAMGKHVMWSKEAFSPARAHAFEIPFGSCGIGGQPEEPKEIVLDPSTDINPAGTDHTVTATITQGGQPVPGVLVSFSVVAGPNAGEVSDPGECSVDPNCNTDASGQTSWTYTSNGAVGVDVIEACFTDDTGIAHCAKAEKEWIDATPPEAACVETVNPHGKTVPKAPANGGQGQNQDGFYEVSATDNVGVVSFSVVDKGADNTLGTADDTVFAVASGDKMKYTEANGATPSIKPGAGVIDWQIKGQGDAAVVAVDAAGNQSVAECLVPNPPK
ncbi:MAG TPA: hypothetical protein VGA53_03410 [Candidatus Paceibacterota bacterium]